MSTHSCWFIWITVTLLTYHVYVGGAITDLAAEQTGLITVQVTWTAPPGPPAGGYQITVAEASIDVTIYSQESPYTFTTSELGVHTVQVLYTSQHFPNEQAMPGNVTVEGEGDSIYEHTAVLYMCTHRYQCSIYHYIITNCHISHHLLESSACSVPSTSS